MREVSTWAKICSLWLLPLKAFQMNCAPALEWSTFLFKLRR